MGVSSMCIPSKCITVLIHNVNRGHCSGIYTYKIAILWDMNLIHLNKVK